MEEASYDRGRTEEKAALCRNRADFAAIRAPLATGRGGPAFSRARTARPPSRPRTTPLGEIRTRPAAADGPEIRSEALPRRGSRPLTRTPGTVRNPSSSIAPRRRRNVPPRSPDPASGEPSAGESANVRSSSVTSSADTVRPRTPGTPAAGAS